MASKIYKMIPLRIIDGEYVINGKEVTGLLCDDEFQHYFEYFDTDCDCIGKITLDSKDVVFGKDFEVYSLHNGFIGCQRYEVVSIKQ